ncbi:reverse transcriptase domain-containing protein [Tanacetum coccineum]
MRFPFGTQKKAVASSNKLKQLISELHHVRWHQGKGREHNVLYRLPGAVGPVLMTERDSIQTSVYFLSRDQHSASHVAALRGASADMSEKEAPQEPWTLFTDGSSCIDGSGAGLILTSPEGAEFTNALRFQFTASNSEAVYEALLVGLRIAQRLVGEPLVEEEGPTWITPITEYLKDGVLLDDKKEANKLCIKARQYELMDGILYRRSMYAGPRSVVAKVMRSGYYWSTMHRDARDMILKCKDCQYKGMVGQPSVGGSSKKVCFGTIYNVVALASGEIVSDNGKQFSDNPFKDWCEKLNITQRFASVKHPQSNGLVERANRSLGEGIKARLGEGNKNWIEEIPHVLWAHSKKLKNKLKLKSAYYQKLKREKL